MIANSTFSLRAVKTLDFMSAEVRSARILGLKFLALTSLQPYEFDFGLLKKISTRIVNEVDGISRVSYDMTTKPPGQLLFYSLFLPPGRSD